jgi:glycine/D-amino acid oxidase-like deaminating enzyme
VAVESEWIGIMGFTPDRNPLVGALATRPGE